MAARRHLTVGFAAVFAVVLLAFVLESFTETWGAGQGRKADGLLWQYNVATGTVALALLVVTLTIGPLRAIRGRGPAVHLPWRRTTGVWTVLLVLAHFPGGIAIHTTGWRVWDPFASAVPGVRARAFDEFTIGYWAGLLALLAMLPLALTSNRRALRRFGAARWKRLHRLAYPVVGLVTVHALSLQYGEGRDLLYVAFTAALLAGVWGAQLAGAAIVRRTRHHAVRSAAAARRPEGAQP